MRRLSRLFAAKGQRELRDTLSTKNRRLPQKNCVFLFGRRSFLYPGRRAGKPFAVARQTFILGKLSKAFIKNQYQRASGNDCAGCSRLLMSNMGSIAPSPVMKVGSSPFQFSA